ncbi:MAG: hypothetical protein NXI23_25400 [Bacteroidetes bacterium]|jgi:UDP-galactopyranose mutase|nr:hypothetical protein [Bacteroidota bacterium]MDF1863447.1 hypothetical protein [Saprospiraceae bacterium]
MGPFNIKLPFTVNDLLNYFDFLSTEELNRISEKITQLLSKRKNESPKDRESFLLNIINQKLPKAFLARYEELKSKMELETLSKSEISEMEAYAEKIEEFDTEKIKALNELSLLRKISFQQLAHDLKAFSRPNE